MLTLKIFHEYHCHNQIHEEFYYVVLNNKQSCLVDQLKSIASLDIHYKNTSLIRTLGKVSKLSRIMERPYWFS